MFEFHFTYLKVPFGEEKKDSTQILFISPTPKSWCFLFPRKIQHPTMRTTTGIAPSVSGLPGQANKRSQTIFMDTGDSQRIHVTADNMSLLSDDTLPNDNKIPRASLGHYAGRTDDHIEQPPAKTVRNVIPSLRGCPRQRHLVCLWWLLPSAYHGYLFQIPLSLYRLWST